MPVRLHINVDHVATVRNARGTPYPDPLFAAQLCEQAGADGITCHLREDRRHIRDDDLARLKGAIQTLLNLEMAATAEMTRIAAQVRPGAVTLVPERREERTTEGGLDVRASGPAIAAVLDMAREQGIRVSLFIEPERDAVEAAHAVGADQIELHTGRYCHAAGTNRAAPELARLAAAAERGSELGLAVAAGHGLTRHNVAPVAAIAAIEELNIGHSVIAEAIYFGLERGVKDLRAAIERGVRMRGR